jgi:hypothetical protein
VGGFSEFSGSNYELGGWDMFIYIRNYSYLEYAGIQSCPLIGKKGT